MLTKTIPGRSRLGSAAIEFALSYLLLWAVLGAVFQFGYAMYAYDRLASAVDGGARYASRVDFDEPAHNFVTQVKNMTVYGNPDGSGETLAPGLTTDRVSVSWTADAKGVPETITVGISDYPIPVVFRAYTYTNKPRVTVKFAGSYKTPA